MYLVPMVIVENFYQEWVYDDLQFKCMEFMCPCRLGLDWVYMDHNASANAWSFMYHFTLWVHVKYQI